MWLIILILVVLSLFYLTSPFHWYRRGVKTYRLPYPLLGSVPYSLGHPLTSWFDDIYKNAGSDPYIGLHVFVKPTLMIKDVDLIRDVLVTDFDAFNSHGSSGNYRKDPLGDHLFVYHGERWKAVRNKISPIFTTSKMKTQFPRLKEDVNKMISVIEDNSGLVDVLELMLKHSTHSAMQFLFGVETDIYEENSLYKKLEDKLFDPTFTRSLILVTFMPKLAEMINFKFGQDDVRDFSGKLTTEAIRIRKESGERRNDFVQVLLDNEKTEAETEYFSDGTLVPNFDKSMQIGNTSLMYSAGVETTGISLAFCLYEIAANPDVQRKIREELRSKLGSKENIDYEDLSTLSYLSMVINESLRIHPLVGLLIRKTTRDYEFKSTGLHLPKDTLVFIPAYSVHMDPNIWPEPQKFDPDRFLTNPKVGSYLPFSQGPRICIGMKLALINMTFTVATLIRKYEVVVDSKCTSPLVLSSYRFVIRPEHPVWLNFKPLKQ